MEQKSTTVGKTSSTIEFNGKRYNVHTGALIDGVRPLKQTPATAAPVARQPHSTRSHTPSKIIHKATQPSKTLMRHAVKKPSTITSRTTVAMDVVSQSPTQAITARFHTADPHRIKRAHSVHKLPTISRFGDVATTPAAAQPPHATEAAREFAAHVPIVPAINHVNAHHSKSDTMIEKGLRAANSHEKHIAKKPKLHHKVGRKIGLNTRTTNFAASSMAVLLLGGFFAYQNIPSISVRYASAKAGVHAKLPGYRPSGFAVKDRIKIAPGEVAIAYQANADKRSYTVMQKNTSWNSEALRNHLIATTGSAPQTFPDNGRTIYLHNGDHADWVNNGIWYSISGKSDLNTDQLIKIATSI